MTQRYRYPPPFPGRLIATSSSEVEVPRWIAGAIGSFGILAVASVFVYGGDPLAPGRLTLGALGASVGLFTLYPFYRFVLAVETIADTH